MKSFKDIRVAEGPVNPGVYLPDVVGMVTNTKVDPKTGKRVPVQKEARASISVGSADKKPENYRDPDGKIKVRMVPVKKTVVQYEAVDYEKLTQLARFGLVDKGNVQKLIAAFKKMEDGKILAPQQRELMLNVLTDLTGIITGDSQMFQKAKKAVKEGTLDEAVEHINILIEMTTAQKAKFDVLYKKMLGGSEHKAIRQKIMNPTKADDAFHAMVKRKAMSEEVESITELTAEEKRLINTMYDKKGNLTDIGKKVMDHGKKNRFPHNTSASQGKMMSGKSTMYSEDTQIDEISMGKMAAYADKAVKSRNDAKARTYSADTHRVAKAGETIRKRKAGADNYNKKMWGYGNVAPTKESVDEGVYTDDLPDTRKKWKDPTSIPRKISHSEIMKAIGNTQSSAQGMAILQKKFKLTAAQARKHMDMFLKDDVQIDEMGAFMAKPLPTPMSMRKTGPMTRPLMLTPQMSKAAELIKKASNTPKLPEATYSDTGWQKPEVKKDKFGNVIKTKNVAKTLAKSGLRQTKDMAKK